MSQSVTKGGIVNPCGTDLFLHVPWLSQGCYVLQCFNLLLLSMSRHMVGEPSVILPFIGQILDGVHPLRSTYIPSLVCLFS